MTSQRNSLSLISPALADRIAAVAADCNECMACVKKCVFLDARGTPKSLAMACEGEGERMRRMAFECSLCGLCAAVCPCGVNPGELFLELRREAAARGELNLRRYGVLLAYERRGHSPLFRYDGMPRTADTVFFPGCTLPGTRPGVVKDVFQSLRRAIPSLGVVLDCCHKPSHDLGRQEHFLTEFGATRRRLLERGVRRVLVACPNCYKVFKAYGDGLEVVSVYETLLETGPAAEGGFAPGLSIPPVAVHDPCPLREEASIHEAVRTLIGRCGMSIEEMRHNGKLTLCCGEGGTVGAYRPDLAGCWTKTRVENAAGRRVVTYCAGCANYLGSQMDVVHVLDLLFRPEASLTQAPPVVRTPWTYVQRLLLKRWFRRLLGQ